MPEAIPRALPKCSSNTTPLDRAWATRERRRAGGLRYDGEIAGEVVVRPEAGGRAAAGTGISVGRPRCTRMRGTTGGSSMMAMKRRQAPQTQASTSLVKTLLPRLLPDDIGNAGIRRLSPTKVPVNADVAD